MKIITTLLLAISFHVVSAQLSYEFGGGYAYTAPINTMKQHIRQGHGLTTQFYITPSKNPRLSLGVDLGLTLYGYDKSRQEYTFEDGTTAKMDIVVDNTFMNAMIAARYFIVPPEGRLIKPYVETKVGYSWFSTSLNIYDPDDSDHCEPVDQDILMKDGTLIFSGSGGIQWDLASIFRKRTPDRLLLNIALDLTLGGKVSYMNTDAPSPSQHNMESDVQATFINTQTQVTHQHHVGYVYTSFVEMTQLRVGLVFKINR
jgi:hypothetical protein